MYHEDRYRTLTRPVIAAFPVTTRRYLATPSGALRRPGRVWLLGTATLGVYWLIWYYRANRELRDFDPGIRVRPALAVLAVSLGALLLVPAAISLYNTGCRIARAQRRAGLAGSVSGFKGVLLAPALALTPFYYQEQLNRVWVARN
ncbi:MULTISPECIES: DUF4234 domain-containing protein [unclassified Streptomyces]|uniref:DUF4234 domain-containing protein n=1 Tax=unclassified Streptomyces TaxID=2593676 RepID=UPI0038102E6C